MLACLQERPQNRPTATELLRSLRHAVGIARPQREDGAHAAGEEGATPPDAQVGAVAAKRIQVMPPSAASPFAAMTTPFAAPPSSF